MGLSNLYNKPVTTKETMANQPAKDKRVLSVQVKRVLYRKLQKYAASQSKPISDTCREILDKAVENIELEASDYEQIARDIANARG